MRDLARPSFPVAAESMVMPSVMSVSPERNRTLERHWLPGTVQSPIVSPKAMRISGSAALPLSHMMPRSVPPTPYRLRLSEGLVGPVTSCSKRVGPRRTGTVPSSPVVHGGIPYTDPTTGSSEPEMPLPSEPVSSCWTREPERSAEPRVREADPSEPESAVDPRDPREPAVIPAPVRFSSREPKLPNISLQGPAAAVPAPIVPTAVTEAARVTAPATAEARIRAPGTRWGV